MWQLQSKSQSSLTQPSHSSLLTASTEWLRTHARGREQWLFIYMYYAYVHVYIRIALCGTMPSLIHARANCVRVYVVVIQTVWQNIMTFAQTSAANAQKMSDVRNFMHCTVCTVHLDSGTIHVCQWVNMSSYCKFSGWQVRMQCKFTSGWQRLLLNLTIPMNMYITMCPRMNICSSRIKVLVNWMSWACHLTTNDIHSIRYMYIHIYICTSTYVRMDILPLQSLSLQKQ